MKTQFLRIIVAVFLILQGFTSYAKEIDPSLLDDFLLEGDGNNWNSGNKSDIGMAFNLGYANGFQDASLFIATIANYEIANSGIIPSLSATRNMFFWVLLTNPLPEDTFTKKMMKDNFVDGEKLSNALKDRYLHKNFDNIKESYHYTDLDNITMYSVKQCANIINRFAIFNMGYTQLQEGLDNFYKEFKNKQIKIHDAIYVVRKQIEGQLPGDIERLLVWLRQGKKDDELLNIRDKDGKIVRVITFP